jgi:gliding motility-associated-like protein
MNKKLQYKFSIIISLIWIFSSNAQITLNTNVGNTLIDTGMPTCDDYHNEVWSKVFVLSDFCITTNDQFIIESGQVGIGRSYGGARIGLAVSAIDDSFPNSPTIGINGGGYFLLPIINEPQIVNIDLYNPIVIPAGVTKILVSVVKNPEFYSTISSEVGILGTEEDTGSSWYQECSTSYSPPISPLELDPPVTNANFYITVTGRKLSTSQLGSSTTLTHNICDYTIETGFPSCSSGMQQWARAFLLSDFGISTNEEFIINTGQIAIESTGGGATITFHIYEIDDNFPNSFSETDLLGSSEVVQIPYESGSDNTGSIHELPFASPVLVGANVERVLVMAEVGTVWGSGVIFIAGTEQDYDNSWFRGCVTGDYQTFTIVNEDLNFFINVNGQINHLSNSFSMNISNICSEFLKEFSIEGSNIIQSVLWDFGDPISGIENTSTDISPHHDFSSDGTYTITATVTDIDGSIEVLTETITAKEPPTAYGIDNIIACEDEFGTGIASFDTSNISSQVLGNQTNSVVTFIDGSGNVYDELPNPFINTVPIRETITVQVAREDELCCLSETSFDLIVNPIPDTEVVSDLNACESIPETGIESFNLNEVKNSLIGFATNLEVDFYYENNQQISTPLNNVNNIIPYEETITVIITDTDTQCSNVTTFKLIVNPLPIANSLNVLYACDDNNDGISEYFDTSNIESQVLNGQTEMAVSYSDQSGNELSNPLPNPYTNTNPFNELITVRVTDINTTCYTEMILELQTSLQPSINQPDNLYDCNEGNGYAEFDTSTIEQQLIGNQTGLTIQYYDSNNNPLPSPLPILFQNTEPFSQTISVRVEDASNPICYSETSFDLIVNELPVINLEDEYFICNLEPSITLSINSGFNSYNWFFEDGTLISSSNSAEITEEGNYTLTVTQIENGITCENSFDFTLIRSVLPEIQQVNFGELGNNYIEIIASGDGNLEYSIDGINYQDNNYFSNIQGGTYTVFVRDKDGCGQDSEEVTVIDYPKFFTPNNDGYNDFWQIKGIVNFPNSKTLIFDRYGKLLTIISSNEIGWNGQYNGKQMMSNDYWFRTDLGNGRAFSGHFSLKR